MQYRVYNMKDFSLLGSESKLEWKTTSRQIEGR